MQYSVVPEDRNERQEVITGIEALERRFREERERFDTALAEMRVELQDLVQRGDALGLSVTSMAKAMKVSRGRLNRMLDSLR